MMFGDVGHGSLWLMVGIGMCLVSDRVKGTSMEGMNLGRYFLLLMGIMATYCGFVYNEFFAIQMNMWGSCYDLNKPTDVRPNPIDTDNQIYRRQSGDCVYPFGQDPAWSISSNALVFANSTKMKMSVILGVLHMTFGIIIKLLNQIQKRDFVGICCDVIAGLIILWGLFGWMDIIIIMKFFAGVNVDDMSKTVPADPNFVYTRNGKVVTDVLEYEAEVTNRNLPSIIAMVIATLIPPSPCPADYSGDNESKWVALQGDSICATFNISFALTMMVAVSVPIMLCTRPCIAKCSTKHSHVVQYDQVGEEGGVRGSQARGINNALNNNGSDEIDPRIGQAEPLEGYNNDSANKVESLMAKRAADDRSLA